MRKKYLFEYKAKYPKILQDVGRYGTILSIGICIGYLI
jgi:hypothetical protein